MKPPKPNDREILLNGRAALYGINQTYGKQYPIFLEIGSSSHAFTYSEIVTFANRLHEVMMAHLANQVTEPQP
jgi:hypothetical protein